LAEGERRLDQRATSIRRAMAHHGRPYDGHSAGDRSLSRSKKLTGIKPAGSHVDLGYRGPRRQQTPTPRLSVRQKRGITLAKKKRQKSPQRHRTHHRPLQRTTRKAGRGNCYKAKSGRPNQTSRHGDRLQSQEDSSGGFFCSLLSALCPGKISRPQMLRLENALFRADEQNSSSGAAGLAIQW